MTSNELNKDLSLICKQLMLEQPFYGILLLNLQKEFSNRVQTAGVGLQGINYKLLINPEFWSNLSQEHKLGLLQHELMHIAFFHPSEWKHLKDDEIANIAMDIEINQQIEAQYLPEGGCTLDKFMQYGLHELEGTNEYYKKLKAAQQQAPPPPPTPCPSGNPQDDDQDNDNQDLMTSIQQAIQEGKDTAEGKVGQDIKLPNHEWDEIEEVNETTQKLIDRQLLTVLDEVVEQVKKMRGTIPGGVAERVEAMKITEPPKFNWKAYLRRYIGNSTKYNVRKTKRKKSKRFELDFGMKIESFSHVLLAIDSSASVSTEEVKEFLREIHHMDKTGHDFSLVFADTSMGEVRKYKRNQPVEIEGRGGTDFNEVVNYYVANKNKYSTLIYLTDGEAPAPSAKIKNVLWVLSKRSHWTDHLPGKTIQLN